MAESDGNRQVVLASMFAVMLAMGSLSLSWFSATNLSGGYCEFTVSQYYTTYDGWMEYDTSRSFSDMANLMGLSVFLIIVWGLLAIVHVGLILSGEKGIVSGVMLVVVSIASVLIPCLGAKAAIVNGLAYSSLSQVGVSVGLRSGCVLAILAALVQTIAVVAGLMLAVSSENRDESEEANRGDLPVR